MVNVGRGHAPLAMPSTPFGEGMPSFRGNQFSAIRAGAALAACLWLANCASQDKFARKVDPKYGVTSSPRVVADGERVPKGGGVYRVGKPYMVAGRTFVPEEDVGYKAEGLASWYGRDFHGRLTANGEVFDQESITAAHPTLPMPSYVRVTNLSNRKSLIVRINDRGPFHGNRVIDLSHKSAQLLGFKDNGVARVRVEYVGRAALEGSDDSRLIATLRQGEPAPAPILVASAGKPLISLAGAAAGRLCEPTARWRGPGAGRTAVQSGRAGGTRPFRRDRIRPQSASDSCRNRASGSFRTARRCAMIARPGWSAVADCIEHQIPVSLKRAAWRQIGLFRSVHLYRRGLHPCAERCLTMNFGLARSRLSSDWPPPRCSRPGSADRSQRPPALRVARPRTTQAFRPRLRTRS